ncbi:PAC2 family protein [Corynebacterium pygosceleis]|uniref:PAC2 family protein n=1 Tax=Corynebacterium pygosceleis TaxID=2800406 RepID=A0A9Q4C739_9CORY|nr:PAC2 family protein [Corynebacterium pygosceleis]MCK7636881.1 PAC2 family protein [Corynebacterium pygosceleis]MCK7674355.1 PAC2 family protein [Corynebacterium pygosceleis]MCL0120347.1 PAC2 family protein [Corynebacterium pygosceleis]MCX7443894.1 PAC2 family protein [Corynebacterium pygosceleis]MCX7467634.1 PAC2 family protein [Corynebacterium pygosceleis]
MQDSSRRMYELEYPAPEMKPKDGTTLVVALQGYADAGQAVDSSAAHLLGSLENSPVAVFNNDELIDYRSRRPAVRISDHEVVGMDELTLGLYAMRDTVGHPFLLLAGPEPDMRWNAFTDAVIDLSERFNVARTLCLYSAPMAVPHTRPLLVTAHGSSEEITRRHFRVHSSMTLPGSASLQLEYVLGSRGSQVAGFTAHVPHYIAASNYPEATLKLLRSVETAGSLSLPLGSLEQDSARMMTLLRDQVDDSGEIAGMVQSLEQSYDEELESYREDNPEALLPGETGAADGEALAEEFERFLATVDTDDREGPTSSDPAPGSPEATGGSTVEHGEGTDDDGEGS